MATPNYMYGDYYFDNGKTIYYDGTKWVEYKLGGTPIGGKIVIPPANKEILTLVGEGLEAAAAAQQLVAPLKPIDGALNSSSSLRYPAEPGTFDSSDYMIFDFYNYEPPFGKTKGAQETNGAYNPTSLAGYNASISDLTKSSLSQIVLYMPEGVSVSYKANWDGKKFGNIAAGVLAASGGFANGNLEGFFKTIGGTVDKTIDRAPAQLGAAAVSAIIGSITGDSVSSSDIFSSVGGQILNPNAELIFGGHDLRTFTFSYKLVPYNEAEAEIIFNKKTGIIATFKKAMLPSFGGIKSSSASEFTKADFGSASSQAIGFIKNPLLVQAHFMSGTKDHEFLPRLKPCTITDFDVNYTADGVYASHVGGYPAAAEINISLIETKLVYAEDIDNGF